MNPHPKKERTFIALKPDAIQRSLVGEIINRLERIGLKIVAMKMLTVDKEHVIKHYTLDPEWRRITGQKNIDNYKAKGLVPWTEDPLEVTDKVLERLVDYMCSGPVIAMVIEGAHSVKLVRKLVGSTEPLSSDVGTIRGDYVLDSYAMADGEDRAIRNLVHASGSVKEAEDEIKHWFTPEELTSYKLVQEKILYDVSLSGLLGE